MIQYLSDKNYPLRLAKCIKLKRSDQEDIDMKNNGTKSFLFIQTVIIVLIGLTTGCTRDKPEFIPGVLAHYINKARLTTVSVKSTLEGKVNTNNVDSWAAIIVDNAAGISILDSVNLEVFKFADSQDYQTRRDDALTDFKARNLIRIGDKVVKTTWSQNGQVFLETYGVERDNGETFEPVPHFHIDEVNSVFVPARPGSWNISSRELYVKNGFGVKAAQGKWDIVIRGNACDITGPPIKVINTLCNEVWLYDAACNDGYKIYAEPKASCPGGQQECMQWVIQLGYTRPDNVSVQVGAAATLYGVTLRGKIDSNDIAWGGTKADWGILCVESGDITSPTSTVIGTSTLCPP